jgi:putative membrane protein
MRRIIVNSLVLAGFAWLSGGCAAMAQTTGSQSPSTQSAPMSRPGTPDVGTPGSVPGNTADAMPTRVDDKKFAKDAALGGMTEVELGKLAAQKGSSDAVKQFGQKMVDDHSKANQELKQVASLEKIDLPNSIDSKHQSRIDKLSKLDGPSFDKAYIKDQVKDHKQDVSAFQSEAQSGTDPNVKQFAAKTLPVLQGHLSLVKDLNKQEKNAAK